MSKLKMFVAVLSIFMLRACAVNNETITGMPIETPIETPNEAPIEQPKLDP